MAISIFGVTVGTTATLTEAQRHVVFAPGTAFAGERGVIRHQWTDGVTDVVRTSTGEVVRRTAADLNPYTGAL